jgi:DNA-directed RNA polymerase III subunit RPC4
MLDQTNGQLTVLGEVNKQFVVSPNVDALLEALDNDDDSTTLPGIVGGGLIQMD